jgi:hypothetical protein
MRPNALQTRRRGATGLTASVGEKGAFYREAQSGRKDVVRAVLPRSAERAFPWQGRGATRPFRGRLNWLDMSRLSDALLDEGNAFLASFHAVVSHAPASPRPRPPGQDSERPLDAGAGALGGPVQERASPLPGAGSESGQPVPSPSGSSSGLSREPARAHLCRARRRPDWRSSRLVLPAASALGAFIGCLGGLLAHGSAWVAALSAAGGAALAANYVRADDA